jgi:diguanylate cyclase (GGDEF)-like protein/PAS domain S-box-containing protein
MTSARTDIPLRALIVEDDENDALLLADTLRQAGYALHWQRVDSERDMSRALDDNWDIVLSDYSMPGFSGTRALSMLRERAVETPFIFVSGTIGEDAAVAAMKAGAQDFVMKGNSKRLLPTIERELRDAQERMARQESERMLRKMSLAIAQSSDGICICDRDGVIEYINPAFEKLTGYSLEELRDRDNQFAQEAFQQQLASDIKDTIEQRSTRITRRKDGSAFYEERVTAPLFNEAGEITHFVSTSRDITGKILAEESRRRLAEILEATPDIVCIIHPTNKLWYLNSAGCQTLQIADPTNIKGRQIDEIFPANFVRLLKTTLSEVLEKGIWSGETELPSEDGDAPYSMVVLAHKNHHGRVKYLSIIARDISERKKFETELQYQATHDNLTGLPNRFLLLDRFRSALQQAKRNQNHVAVMFVDLDNFKRVNDSLGHAAGDQFLAEIATRLRRCLRPHDTIARHGGDEFTIILTDIKTPENVLAVVNKLQEEFVRPILTEENEIYATFSTGISLYPEDGDQPEELLRHADSAMYNAKKAGSNQYCFYAPAMNARSREILMLEAELRRAIELREFSLFYQPQLDLTSGAIIGLEALIRWHHTGRGLVPPAEFVGLLETSGLIISVGEWIIRQACRQHANLRHHGFGEVRISVNVSALQFGDRDFLAKVQRILREENMPADHLELEITENIIMQDPEATVVTLNALRRLGVRSAIDDFGTGYSSLSYLKKFPINLLKIDQTFIRDLQTERGDSAIVEASIALAQKLNLEIVAEGVETEAQLNFLRDCKCGIAQGYYVSRPIPGDAVAKWLESSPLVA